MQTKGKNTILITGGGSGIGRGLAEAFHKLGNTVIVAGRRREALDEVVAANPGMQAEAVDLQDAEALASFAGQLTTKYPALNVVIHNAGIMKHEDAVAGLDPATIVSTIATNLSAPLQLTAALLPHLLAQAEATIMTLTSGLAFAPLALAPTYCATKAAIHSWSESLRFQLQDTSVRVIELAPPYVQTELMGAHQASDARAMPLAEFLAETMELLTTQPGAKEILVKRVHAQRFAGDFNQEKFDAFFDQYNHARKKR